MIYVVCHMVRQTEARNAYRIAVRIFRCKRRAMQYIFDEHNALPGCNMTLVRCDRRNVRYLCRKSNGEYFWAKLYEYFRDGHWSRQVTHG